MTDTARHELPMLSAGQAQKEVTHNEALLAIDRLLQLAVVSRTIAVPPPAPPPGSIYIVAPAASGAWAGAADRLASHDGYGWTFTDPVRGCLAWIADEAVFSVYDDGWLRGGWPANGLRIAGRQVLAAAPVAVTAPGGGAVIDVEGRVKIAELIVILHNQGIIL